MDHTERTEGAESESDLIQSLQQKDLRFNNLAKRSEGPFERFVVGGPGEPSDEAMELDLGRGHSENWNLEKMDTKLGEETEKPREQRVAEGKKGTLTDQIEKLTNNSVNINGALSNAV